MIIKSIRLKEGMFERKINFSNNVNLIHSSNNSCGKTTLLRFILYVLGYNVPNTRKIKFKDCEVEAVVNCEKIGDITLLRYSDIVLEATIDNNKQTFVLPDQEHDLHKLLFGTDNADILNNILGTFYMDQEKGWTLLNRGVVIGSIHFNINELIRGIAGIDCEELIDKEAEASRQLVKYRQMFSVAQYRESLDVNAGNLLTEDYEEVANAKESQLLIRQRELKQELLRIDRTLSDNKKFKKYVSDMKLFVEAPDGTTFPVTEDNIVGLNDSLELLIAKRKIVSSNLVNISKDLQGIHKEKKKEYEQMSFTNTASQLEIFDRQITKLPINQAGIKKEILRIEAERKVLREQINRKTKDDNKIVSEITDKMIQYMIELGVGTKETISRGYLFTSNLKELSGAVLHKTAFAFRLAYISIVEKRLNIKLPIILDSPSGKEVDPDNVEIMMNILKRDFSENQLIIASIYRYDFNNVKEIEIKDRLIEAEILRGLYEKDNNDEKPQ